MARHISIPTVFKGLPGGVSTFRESVPKKVPFRAQHLVLEAVQKMLEQSGFRFIQRWLPQACRSAEWVCAESMELHRLFPFLNQNRKYASSKDFHQILAKLHSLRHTVSNIRHTAVHRIVQDSESLLEMLQAAVAFASCIGDKECTQQLEFLCSTLNNLLFQMNERLHHLQQRVLVQIRICHSRPAELMQRRALLPEAVRRLTEQSKDMFNLQVQGILRKNLLLC
ncbi:unnamed protein product [Penicillium nalgiovense]|nr:unnamed protein product [Penicillium nalgiovense]